MDLGIRGEDARDLSERLIKLYFKTQDYPYTRHHIESFDQFLSQDLPAIMRAANPLTLLQKQIADTSRYAYKAEIFVGGLNADRIYIGSPTLSLQDSKEIRLLFPNEARLRNLSYSSIVEVDIVIRITMTVPDADSPGGYKDQEILMDPAADPTLYGFLARFPIFRIPIMLHSRYCLLHGKPQTFLKEAGECQYDQGGYFIVNGSEKVLITHQQQAFNTLYISPQPRDPQVEIFSNISCLNPVTRQIRYVAFLYFRKEETIQVNIPYVRKSIPVFVLFRALGIQSDEDILRLLFPDPDGAEAKILQPLLRESILEAHPFYDTYSAIQYIKILTKGFSVENVLYILHNHLFVHVEDRPKARASFLAECVRKILRVKAGIDQKTDRDDIRNQRCLSSGVLCRQMFQGNYNVWVSAVLRKYDEEYKYHVSNYEGANFQNLFIPGTMREMFREGQLTEGILRAFKGKWVSGTGVGIGEEKSGVIQSLSRLSFLDFMSHCRRVVLDFDTGMKLPSPRRLHTSQYGYFCTSETPGGASIGITKNLSVLTSISIATDPTPVVEWLLTRGEVTACDQMVPDTLANAVPVIVNTGIIGYTFRPIALRDALKALKWTGCLPASCSVGFSIRERRVFLFLDEGRPIRPLIHLGPGGSIPVEALRRAKSWRDLVMGVLPATAGRTIYQTGFTDPLAREEGPSLEDYVKKLAADAGVVEYMDPYEMNEAYIANFPEHIQAETSHMEIHPSTIVGLLTSMIPYANHNQSPRNQLSCSQSKQGLSVYSTAYPNRYDNQVHVLCYGQAPLVRTIYYDYLADGQMGYGHNLILAMGCFTGYNQDDGILMNMDSIERGMFRSTCYRSYEAFEENTAADGSPAIDNAKIETRTRIGNPAKVSEWLVLRPGIDYTKLDERGVVRVGEMVDENTVLVGRYIQTSSGEMRDASVTAQVWTRGRVEKVSVVLGPTGLATVKVRVVQERIPELGDKFCLTPDHEVLTKEDGWLSIDKVNVDHTVAQLNRNSGLLEYVKPKEVFEFDHSGDMYEVKTQGVNLCTTLNHRMWIQERNSKEYELKDAKSMMGRRVRFSSYSPTSSSPFYIKVGDTILNENEMNAFITLFGIWIAEGWVYKNEEQYIYRIEIAANKLRVKNALDSASSVLGLKTSFNEGTKKYYINTKEYVKLFEPLSIGAINKRLPSWCFEMSEEQSKLLVESLCLGDGSETSTSLYYSTSSKQLRDDLQIIVQHAGYTSGYFKHVECGSTRVDSSGRIYRANADNWHIQIRRKRVFPTLNHGHAHKQGGQSEKIVQYEGKVYCISVPSEVFLVRREGSIVWTGNSNRHGQKGTIGMLLRSYDMPRTRAGIPVDMIMNTHALPSRMTVAQLLETLLGKAAGELGAIGNATLFMNEGNPATEIGKVLRDQLGMEPLGDDLLYDGMSGQMIPAQFFVGNCYTMRLKHMPEDKWNARAEGRREQRTHQPTGGRGAQGGLRIGEMERDALLGHGITDFVRESYMKRSDGTAFYICNGCGTIPIYNEAEKVYICTMCDGPVTFTEGATEETIELLPPNKRSVVTMSKVEMPYSMKLLNNEMNAYMNMGMRFLTDKDLKKFQSPPLVNLTADQTRALLDTPLPERQLSEANVPEFVTPAEEEEALNEEITMDNLEALGAVDRGDEWVQQEEEGAQGAQGASGAMAAPPAPMAIPQSFSAVPANGLPTVVLQPAAAAATAAAEMMEEDMDAMPYDESSGVTMVGPQQGGAAPAPAPIATPGVNVQASSQPVLVLPVNVSQPVVAPPAEIYSSGIPGGPTTIAVDTSPGAMMQTGLPAMRPTGNTRGGSRSRSSSAGSRHSGSGGGAHPMQKVTVNKVGGGVDSAAASAPNVRVSVTKLG